MVKALFDTNILIDFLQGPPEAKRELARYEDPAISVICWVEVMAGATAETAAGTRAFLDRFEVLGVGQAVAELAVEPRRENRVKLPDAIIWATARRHGLLLVTRNTRDFPADDPGVRAPYIQHPGPPWLSRRRPARGSAELGSRVDEAPWASLPPQGEVPAKPGMGAHLARSPRRRQLRKGQPQRR